jgi:hypothetical protein
MNSAHGITESLGDEHADSPDATASIGELARATSTYVRAWSTLLASETRLAGQSAIRIALSVLIFPAIVSAMLLASDALVASVVNHWLHDWAACIAIVLFLDLAALCALLVAMRRWWRDLSLPRSRDALVQLLEKLS